jgi:hypothetical protein
MARVSGTQALSTTAVQLPNQSCNWASIRNNDAAIAVLIGWTSATQSYTIPAGQHAQVKVTNLNQLWAKSASGTPTLSYLTQ